MYDLFTVLSTMMERKRGQRMLIQETLEEVRLGRGTIMSSHMLTCRCLEMLAPGYCNPPWEYVSGVQKFQDYEYKFVSDLHIFHSRIVEQHSDLF